MKIWAYIALATILTGFIMWGYNAVYKAGSDSAELACSVEREKDASAHVESLNSLIQLNRETEAARDEIARKFYQSSIKGAESNAQLRRELSQQETECRNGVAYVSAESIRLLNECTNDAGLPEGEKQGFVREGAATAIHVSEYACYAIGQYNKCAKEVNAAIDELAQ